jgi:peptidylprolyl isomerase
MRNLFLSPAVMLALLWSAPLAIAQRAGAPPSSELHVVLSVGEESLTAADVEAILQSLPPQSRSYYSGEGRHLLPQFLVQMKVLAAEARKENLDEQPEMRQAIRFAEESILAEAARRRIEQAVPAPDDLVTQLYQTRKREFEEVRLRRILIRTESSILTESSAPNRAPLTSAQARAKLEGLRQQALEGADFAALAREHSDDAVSAAKGGDMGFVGYMAVIPPISRAAETLEPGKVSEIIPTPYGLEMIQLVEKRTKPLAEVRPQLEAILRQSKLQERIQELQGQHKITVDSEYFAPRAPGSPAAPYGAPVGR